MFKAKGAAVRAFAVAGVLAAAAAAGTSSVWAAASPHTENTACNSASPQLCLTIYTSGSTVEYGQLAARFSAVATFEYHITIPGGSGLYSPIETVGSGGGAAAPWQFYPGNVHGLYCGSIYYPGTGASTTPVCVTI